jgi:hypothetical protein
MYETDRKDAHDMVWPIDNDWATWLSKFKNVVRWRVIQQPHDDEKGMSINGLAV